MRAQSGGGSSGGGGCGPVTVLLIAGFLAVRYWYVSLMVVGFCVALYVLARRREAVRARHRPGRADAWCNEVNVACADLGLAEHSRNQCPTLGGVAALGDVTLRSRTFESRLVLFADGERAHAAEIARRANERTRAEIRRGARTIVTRDRVVFEATGRAGRAVDEFLLDEVVRVVNALPTRVPGLVAGARPGTATGAARADGPGDALGRIRALGALRDAGTITEDEFADTKASLLKRV